MLHFTPGVHTEAPCTPWTSVCLHARGTHTWVHKHTLVQAPGYCALHESLSSVQHIVGWSCAHTGAGPYLFMLLSLSLPSTITLPFFLSLCFPSLFKQWKAEESASCRGCAINRTWRGTWISNDVSSCSPTLQLPPTLIFSLCSSFLQRLLHLMYLSLPQSSFGPWNGLTHQADGFPGGRTRWDRGKMMNTDKYRSTVLGCLQIPFKSLLFTGCVIVCYKLNTEQTSQQRALATLSWVQGLAVMM